MEPRVSALRGMTFEIRRTPPEEKLRRKKEKLEEAKKAAEKEYILNLVPFGNVPHIPFDNIKYGETAVRTVVVVNRTSKPVHVILERLPKPEKGFEVDYVDFVMNAKEEAQLKIGWVPQGGTPLRETVYVKFGKLKTQMLLVGTCKVPQSMVDKRKPLRPTSVQNLKRQSLNSTSMASKKDLPPNPVARQPQGACPPVRPYVAETNLDDKSAVKKVSQETDVSWSPQPFKMAATTVPKQETFVASNSTVFDMKENVESPRRDTFVVPCTDQLRRDTYLCPPKASFNTNNDTFRRDTFVPSNCPMPMVTSTPRVGGSPQLDFLTPGEERRQTYVLPSTVKKPQPPVLQSPSSLAPKPSKSPIVEEAKQALREVANLQDDQLDLTLKDSVRLSAIKEEGSSNVPTDIDQLLEISGVDLDLSPEKKRPAELSGINMIAEQTLSLPPKSTSDVKLQLSNGGQASNISSETYIKDDVANLNDFDGGRPLSANSETTNTSIIANPNILSDSIDALKSSSPLINRTPVKTLSFEEDLHDLSNVSTTTYVKSPMLHRIEEDDEDGVEESKGTNIDETYKTEDQQSKSLTQTTAYKLLRNAMLRQVYEKNHAAVIIQGCFRRFMEERKALKWMAAITIQASWKGFACRASYLTKRRSVILIQSWTRMWIARRKFQAITEQRNSAALIIQTNFKKFKAIQLLNSLKEDKAATTIQAAWKGYQQKMAYQNTYNKIVVLQSFARMCIQKKRLKEIQAQRQKCAVLIQAAWKGYACRSSYMMKREKLILIQAWARMLIARQKYKMVLEQRNSAALIIQRNFKKFKAIQLLTCLKKDKAATTIQATWRGYQQRLAFKNVYEKIVVLQSFARMILQRKQYQLAKRKREESAIRIQAWIRMCIARQKYETVQQSRNSAALIIQRNFKKIKAVRVLRSLREERAATLIQAAWRGYVQRMLYQNSLKKIVLLQSLARMCAQRKAYRQMQAKREKCAIVIQAWARMWIAQQKYHATLEKRNLAATIIQRNFKKIKAIRLLKSLREEKAATLIQASFRGYIQKNRYQNTLKKIVLLQSLTRMCIQRKSYQQILAKRERCAVTIQAWTRMWIARLKYHATLDERNTAAIIIQRNYKKFAAMKLLILLKEHRAATTVQAAWRGYQQWSAYKNVHQKIVVLQSFARMCIQKNRYRIILAERENCATRIQAVWKGYSCRTSYLVKKESAVLLQAWTRMWIAKRKYQAVREQRNTAALIIQRNVKKFKAIKLLKSLREDKAATSIQAAWKGYQQRCAYQNIYTKIVTLQSFARMCIQMKHYHQMQRRRERCAVVIQKTWRMFAAVQSYQKSHKSIILIQSLFRRKQAQAQLVQLRTEFQIMKENEALHQKRIEAAITIQTNFRRVLAVKQLQTLRRDAAATKIQSVFKGYRQRLHYQDVCRKIVTIQSYVRMSMAMKKYQQMQSKRQASALVIQKQWRMILARKNYKKDCQSIILVQAAIRRKNAQLLFQKLKADYQATKMIRDQMVKENSAAESIQKYFRGMQQRKQFLKMKRAAIILQSFSRMVILRKSYQLQLQRRTEAAVLLQRVLQGWVVRREFIEQKRAATLIKAAWKSYKLRMAMKKEAIAKQLAEVQRRVDEAHKNATEDQKLCNRTSFALDYLYNYKDMAMLIEALNNLNVTLRYSTNCCVRMLEEDAKALSILMDILNGLNRSVPHIEVMSIILDILISLAEFNETRAQLAAISSVYPSVISTMSKGEKNVQVFGKGCSLLFRLAAEKSSKSNMKDQRIFKKLKEFEDTQNRLKRRTNSSTLLSKPLAAKIPKKKSLTTKHGCQLTDSIVRFHADPHLAISGLMKRLSK